MSIVADGIEDRKRAEGRGSRTERRGSVAWAIAIAIVAVLAACEPAKPRAPLEPLPEELLASVAIGPADTLNGLRAYLDAVQPGVSSFLSDDKVRAGLGEMVGASSLTGLDPKSWSYVLVANVEGKPA